MSTIGRFLVGNTAGLTRVEKALRYIFFALVVGTAVYSVGGTFFGRDSRLSDYGLAMSTALIASLSPGFSRSIPSARWALRTCEWVVMGCALTCNVAVIAGDVTDAGTSPEPFNMATNVAMGATFVAICFFTVLLIARERARRRGPIHPAG